MKQVPHLRLKNIRHHRTEFSHHGDLAQGVCETLLLNVTNTILIL